MVLVLKIIMFDLISRISLNFEEKTCDKPSKC